MIIIVIILAIIGFVVLTYCYLHSIKNQNADNSSEKQELQNQPQEIVIYDIEEGYLTVPYNVLAEKHEYDFDNFLKNENGFYQYEDEKYQSKLGVDVSTYQGIIDWKKVKKAGIEFAILRLGFRGYGQAGNIVLDANFERNYKAAKKEGIEIGVYFFSQAINLEEIKEEANFVLKHIKGKEITYPIAFDLENIKNDVARTDNLTSSEMTNMTQEFCKIMEEKGYMPSIYGNAKTFTTKMQLELLNHYQKWYADYQEKPLYPYAFTIWQYTEKRKSRWHSRKCRYQYSICKKTGEMK